MVHATLCCGMFGPLMTQALPHKMIVKKMMKTFVLCVVNNAPPRFVGSAMRGIALDVLTLTLVAMKLCKLHHNFAIFLCISNLSIVTFPCYNTPCIISLEHSTRQAFWLWNKNA